MARCSYGTLFLGEEWECPLDALPGEEHCYWHKRENGKTPNDEQLKELWREKIVGVYLQRVNLQNTNLMHVNLQKANLIWSNLQKVNLSWANLQGSDLLEANLMKTDLRSSNLQGTYLTEINLQESYLYDANLQESRLDGANLQKANLISANLKSAFLTDANLRNSNLSGATLQGANLHGASFDSKTNLENSILVDANLYRSYFDEAKSFRNATVFQKEGDKEINEIVGDALGGWFIQILEKSIKHPVKMILDLMSFAATKISKKKPYIPLFLKPSVLDMEIIRAKSPSVAAKFRGKGLIRFAGEDNRIIFFDRSSGCVIENPENWRRHERNLIRVEGLANLILRDRKIRPEFLYDDSRVSPYEASYEIYNNLYNFYIANGRLDQAAHVHYRRGEVHRKLRWARGGLMNRARSIFDLLILNLFTGYGDRILRPIFWSGVIIGVFAALFWHFDGIVKNVNGELATPDWVDYLYHSITTFTSLGYSNIQPNLAAGHLPQILVAAESGLGVLMMALIIFVVTYQVSR